MVLVINNILIYISAYINTRKYFMNSVFNGIFCTMNLFIFLTHIEQYNKNFIGFVDLFYILYWQQILLQFMGHFCQGRIELGDDQFQ